MFESPLHARVVALNETWRYKDWAGLVAPARYVENHVTEYAALRHAAGLLDVSPLYKLSFSGRDAAKFLSRTTTRDVTRLAMNRVTYLCWCDDDGHVVDDGTLTRVGEDRFFLTAAEPAYGWFATLARGFDVVVDDVSRQIAALAVQGPTSRAVLAACCAVDSESDVDVAALRFFGSTRARVDGRVVRVTRTGYTGDLGYELWCDAHDALTVWDAVVDAGRAHALVPVGLDALDMARIEAGFVLLGVDYFSAPRTALLSKRSTPASIGLDAVVELDRAPFVGQEALMRERARGGPAKRVVGLALDWSDLEALYASRGLAPALATGASRESLPIYDDGVQIGRASSSVWSPLLKRAIAIGTVHRAHAATGTVVEVEHTVHFERRVVRATVVERPFYDPPHKRGR